VKAVSGFNKQGVIMLTKKTVKTYSIPIVAFSKEGFAEFVEIFGIDLGAHTPDDIYYTAENWPYVEWDRQRNEWCILKNATMEILPQHYSGT
jgi:hypothetical protein